MWTLGETLVWVCFLNLVFFLIWISHSLSVPLWTFPLPLPCQTNCFWDPVTPNHSAFPEISGHCFSCPWVCSAVISFICFVGSVQFIWSFFPALAPILTFLSFLFPNLQGRPSDYHLWVISGKDDPAYPLIGKSSSISFFRYAGM